MTIIAATIVGYLVGSLPTANTLARFKGVDLRKAGSGNPGTNNARQLGGYGLAASILLIEFAKGAGASLLGLVVEDEMTAVVAGVAAIAGNVYNIWYRFRGGKGLAIGGGVLLTLWPPGFALAVVAIAGLAAMTKSSGKAAVGALTLLVVAGSAWSLFDYSNAWGVRDTTTLPYLAAAMALLIMPKHLLDIRTRVTPLAPS
jgi:glycerol-3-phosphate acyltransferase PlsY